MNWRHWTGIVLGAAAGVALAVALHRYAKFADPMVDEKVGEVVY